MNILLRFCFNYCAAEGAEKLCLILLSIKENITKVLRVKKQCYACMYTLHELFFFFFYIYGHNIDKTQKSLMCGHEVDIMAAQSTNLWVKFT